MTIRIYLPYTLLHIYSCTGYEVSTMPHDGVLATRQTVNLMTYYAIAQCMFIFVCVSCWYQLIVYHITFSHVDVSKMISIRQLWDVFVISASAGTSTNNVMQSQSNSTNTSPALISLEMQLKKYMRAKTPAIHIYTVRVGL